MTTRQLSIAAGKAHAVSRFSEVRPANPFVCDELALTLNPTLHNQRRDAILFDPQKVSQFACLWNGHLAFLTRPTLYSRPGHLDETFVIGSLSDRIGEVYPVRVPLDVFQAHVTTLVRREDAEHFALGQHPVAPDTVQAPVAPLLVGAALQAARDARAPATFGRLNFDLGGEANADHPRVVALPCFLPLGPGQSFPERTPVMGGDSLRDTCRLVEVWRRGMAYARTHNAGFSVTSQGPMFDIEEFVLAPGQDEPFGDFIIRDELPPNPEALDPLGPEAVIVRTYVDTASSDAWVALGSDATPEAAAPGGGGLGGDELRLILESQDRKPTKEKEQDEAALEIAHYYRLALAGFPPTPAAGAPSTAMIIPVLSEEFRRVLAKTKPVSAATEFRRLVSGQSESRKDLAESMAIDQDVTLSEKVVTTAFSNALRSYHWLLEPLAHTPKGVAQQQLNLLHFLPPDTGAAFFQRSSDAADAPMVMSHISDDKAQLEASKGSRMYTGGLLESGRNVYDAVVNLRFILRLLLANQEHRPAVIHYLLEFVKLLTSQEGKSWLRLHRFNRNVAVHLFQDAQHVLFRFLLVATSPKLRKAVADGDPVGVENFRPAVDAARAIVDRLRVIVGGHDLGAFAGTPLCLSWFNPAPSNPQGGSPKGPKDSPRGDKPKERLPPARAADGDPKRPKLSQEEIDGKKRSGLFVFDSTVGGNRLPQCPVVHKHNASSSPERLCMQFMTQGRFCSRSPCVYPHIRSLNALAEPRRAELIKFVADSPGLAWAPGKAPPGTSS